MNVSDSTLAAMPDIAADGPPEVVGRLGWVGMQDIEAPVNLAVEGGVAPQASARVTAFVNLVRPEARGIHMSRLYLHVDQLLSHEPLTPGLMMQLLDEFMRSHDDLSDGAYVRVDFDYLVRRSALRSDNSGWRRYPVHVAATRLRGQTRLEIGARIVYSSTCPCSAALARQIIQQNFERDFEGPNAPSFEDVRAWLGTERAISATPHSQRSHADLRVVIDEGNDLFPLLDLIDQVENALATPVQAAVKREDEQAFAQLNGENLMFCEDAARRIQHALNGDPRFVDFWARASHRESLHPHDAVAVACKGIPGGFTP